jgi:pyridinium-3,5-biscarboxylic acid mononucleotide sulfurtransferase
MNADDTRDYRPGQRAAEEHAVLAPLAEAGLTKLEIRALAKAAGYPLWDRPAAPCLSSRVEYGRTVTREVLSQVERAEESLRQLGFRELRVRHHGELARVEIARAELPRALAMDMLDAISAALKQAGFQYVTLDCTGFRSGLDERDPARRSPLPARCIAESLESTSMRTAYLECFSGISGDMLLGAWWMPAFLSTRLRKPPPRSTWARAWRCAR